MSIPGTIKWGEMLVPETFRYGVSCTEDEPIWNSIYRKRLRIEFLLLANDLIEFMTQQKFHLELNDIDLHTLSVRLFSLSFKIRSKYSCCLMYKDFFMNKIEFSLISNVSVGSDKINCFD